MAWKRIIIRYDGRWHKAEYVGGDEILIYMEVEQICRENIIKEIRGQLGKDKGGDYMLFYTTSAGDGRRIKVLVRSDVDLLRLIVEQHDEPTLYVVEKGTQAEEVDARCNNSGVHHDLEEQEELESSDDEEYDPESCDDEEDDDAFDGDEEELVSSDEERGGEIFEELTAEFAAWIRQPSRIDKVVGYRSLSSQHKHSDETDNQEDGLSHEPTKWLIPMIGCDTPLPLDWAEPSGPLIGELVVGSLFRTKCDLAIAVGMFHMENQVEYKTERSSRNRLGYVCKHGNECPFLVRARQKGGTWRIIKVNKSHTCHLDLNRTNPRQVPAIVIGKYFSRKLIDERVELVPKQMIGEMLRLFGIEMNYCFALRARNIAIDFTYGDFGKSYQMIPSYLYLLRESNPGTVYDIQTKTDDEFLTYVYGPSTECAWFQS